MKRFAGLTLLTVFFVQLAIAQPQLETPIITATFPSNRSLYITTLTNLRVSITDDNGLFINTRRSGIGKPVAVSDRSGLILTSSSRITPIYSLKKIEGILITHHYPNTYFSHDINSVLGELLLASVLVELLIDPILKTIFEEATGSDKPYSYLKWFLEKAQLLNALHELEVSAEVVSAVKVLGDYADTDEERETLVKTFIVLALSHAIPDYVSAKEKIRTFVLTRLNYAPTERNGLGSGGITQPLIDIVTDSRALRPDLPLLLLQANYPAISVARDSEGMNWNREPKIREQNPYLAKLALRPLPSLPLYLSGFYNSIGTFKLSVDKKLDLQSEVPRLDLSYAGVGLARVRNRTCHIPCTKKARFSIPSDSRGVHRSRGRISCREAIRKRQNLC